MNQSTLKTRTLLVGCGGVGTIVALNLEIGRRTEVTAVLRSNYEVVQRNGFSIKSCDHVKVANFKPTQIINTIPSIITNDDEEIIPFKYIICTTKNTPDIPPSLALQIGPAVTPGHTIIILIQNGLNIERPFLKHFPHNIILSGVSMIGSHEISPGEIEHDFPDHLIIGAFRNKNINPTVEDTAAKEFVQIYSCGGKTKCEFVADVGFSRWRKLVYNACLNSICAITGLDTGRIRLADGAVEMLVRPAMREIVAAAKMCGYDLPACIVDDMIEVDPLRLYLAPSMLVDVRKGNFIEFENILGEPLREGLARGVPMPVLQVLYGLCKALQWRAKEARGLVSVLPKLVPGVIE